MINRTLFKHVYFILECGEDGFLWHHRRHTMFSFKKVAEMTIFSRTMDCFFSRFKSPVAPKNASRGAEDYERETTKSRQKNSSGNVLEIQSNRKENTLFKAAKDNDVKSLIRLLQDKNTDPFAKGTVGENILHVAALYNNVEALVAILDVFPFLINEPIDCDMYRGETTLHIAIVNQNIAMVKQLLAQHADTENARAVGTFFAPGKEGQYYYGEYVLSFAACIGNEEILQMLVKYGTPLHSQDRQGNTVFHMLVLHPNKSMACKMYDFLASLIPNETILYLESITNKKGFTPLKLAAHEGDIIMFNHFMKKRKQVYWAFGPVTSTLYELTGIDTWGDELSVLDIICSSKKKGARKLMEVTPLKELLHHKWTHHGYKYFLLWTVLYVLYTIIFTVCCIYRPLRPAGPDGDNISMMVLKPLNEAYSTKEDFVRMAGEILTVLGAFLILLTEIPRLVHIGPIKYFGNTVTGGPFHVIMMVYASFIVITVVLRLIGHNGETITMSFALISAWCNVIYFARGFKLLGPLCIMIQKMIFGDLMRFCSILIIVIIGFGAAFDVHFQALNPTIFPYFKDFPITIFTLFQLMMGLTNLAGPPDVTVPDIIIILYMVYMFFAFILLLNILIALMGDTHYRVAYERKSLWKAQVPAYFRPVVLTLWLSSHMWLLGARNAAL
nr:PREDICTED: transient receptor potential cation channel subfamily V member 6-like [Latimeria chalumnae]|eukprot:XP_006002548.1 PREDICTED: transient receptor potential cation channel subfamily V member 6-like [Latimeria chalumnae]